MSLKLRVALLTGLTMLLAVGLAATAVELLVSRSFTQLETSEATSNSNRVAGAIDTEIAHLGHSATDWAQWDETYDFTARTDSEYADRNLMASAFSGLGVNLMHFYDRDGKLVWGKTYDLKTGEEIAESPFPGGTLPQDDLLLSHPDESSAHEGIVLTPDGPMLVVSRPVLRTGAVGPVGGTLILGRFLDDVEVVAMREQVAVSFDIVPASAMPSLDTDFVIETQPDFLVSYQLLPDIYGNPLLAIAAKTPREMSAAGARTVQFSIICLLVIGLLDILVLWTVLQRFVLRPVGELTEEVARIGGSGGLEERVAQTRRDELGVLARAFNGMLDRLSEARRQLVEQSHRSGMAEMATGVLHNLRNGLNPLVSRLDALNGRLLDAPGSDLQRAMDEQKNPATPAPRRERLGEYIGLTAAALLRLRDAAVVELTTVSTMARRLGDIVNNQDKFIYTSSVIEPVRLADTVRDALSLLSARVQDEIAIEIHPSVEALAPALAEKVGLMQVLHNLLVNAAEAIARSGRSDGAITISAIPERETGAVHLAIADNGIGIDPAQLEAVFQRGYTTKGGGKGGLGLHWCAIAVANMRGRLYAECRTDGSGAVFHLLLPAVAERMAA